MTEKLPLIEKKLIKGVLKPTSEFPIIPLRNTIRSYHIFFKDAPYLFECRNIELRSYVEKGVKVIYFLNRKFIEYHPPPSSFRFCKEKGEAYEGVFHVKTTITKKIIFPDKILENDVYVVHNKYQVPVFVGIYGRPVDGTKEIEDDPCEFACCFFGKNHVTRTIINLLDANNSSPQVKITKNKSKTSIHESNAFVNSFTCRVVLEEQHKQPQYLNFILNTKKSSFIVSSKNVRNFLPSIEVIHFISYLTRLSLFQIEEIILSLFSKRDVNNQDRIEIYDANAYYNIYRFFRQIEDTFDSKEEKSIKKRISEYIVGVLGENLSETIQGFLPMVNSIIILCQQLPNSKMVRKSSNRMKGFTLLEYVIQHFQAKFQARTYPSGDHIIHTSTITPGMSFVRRVNEETQQKYNKIKKAVEQLPISISEKSNEPLKLEKGLQENLFTSSMSSKSSHMFVITKPMAPLPSDNSKINQANTTTKNTNHLKKTKKRDVDESNFLQTGIATTPDNEYVNLQHNLNAAVTSGNKTIAEQTEAMKNILTFIFNHKYFKSASTEIPVPNDITISIIDKSSCVLGFVSQQHGEEFYQDLRQAKRKSLFHSIYLDIWRVPNYKQNSSTSLLLPIKEYNNIRISLAHHDLFRPALIVQDGKLKLEEYDHDDPIFELRPEEICRHDHEILELLGSGELTYTNNILGISNFLSLSEEDRKKIEYVVIGGILCKSFNEAISNDTERTNGARATFACGQQKNNVNTQVSSFLNNNESSKTLERHQQFPLITNAINRATKADERSYCSFFLVAWGSFTNAEDSCTINESCVKNHMTVVKMKPYKSADSFSTKDISRKAINDDNYDADGKIRIQSAIREGEAFNNEVVLRVHNGSILKDDKSHLYDNKQPGRVDNLIQIVDGWKFRICSRQPLSHGDKMSDLCAQKFTIQRICKSHEMPYNAMGERVQMMLNSYSTFGRETYNVISTLLKYELAIRYYDPLRGPIQIEYDPFSQDSLADYVKENVIYLMKTYNISEEEATNMAYCKDKFFDPYTGMVLEQSITCGIYPICRLTQTAQDSYSIKKEFEFNANNEVSGSRMSEMDLMAQAETGAIALQDELQPDNIMIRRSYMICSNCGQPATKTHKYRSSFWTCIVCENAGLTPLIKLQNLPHQAVKIMQMSPTLGITFNLYKDDKGILYPTSRNV